MEHKDFNVFLDGVIGRIKTTLTTKSKDYSNESDKLYNFKLSAGLDGITSVEALRGMHLKHRTSLCQGLDDLQRNKVRSEEWWTEKIIDSINYEILLLAMLKERYFIEVECGN